MWHLEFEHTCYFISLKTYFDLFVSVLLLMITGIIGVTCLGKSMKYFKHLFLLLIHTRFLVTSINLIKPKSQLNVLLLST